MTARLPDELFPAIMEEVRNGSYLKDAVARAKITKAGFYKRVNADPALKALWREIIGESADMWAEKADQIVQELLDPENKVADPKRAQIAIEHFRWRAEKANPQRYGQRQTLEHTGDSESYIDAMRRAQPMILKPEAKKPDGEQTETNVVKLENKGKVS